MDYTIKRKLICQVPMIHFQCNKVDEDVNRAGTALRATEVKPKLDRFLMRKYRKEYGKNPLKEWMVCLDDKPTGAFQYKMLITQDGKATAKEPYGMYYGNTGKKTVKKMQLYGDFTLKITCFIPMLLDFVEENIDEFFIVTNFGTMSSKGYGSYLTEKWLNEYNELEPREKHNKVVIPLCEETCSENCYFLDGYNDSKEALDDIQRIYGVMKSGYNQTDGIDSELKYHRSFLFDYCYQEGITSKKIPNEKAYMKQTEISPVAFKDFNSEINTVNASLPNISSNGIYVRALLGIGEQISYISGYNHQLGKTATFKKGQPDQPNDAQTWYNDKKWNKVEKKYGAYDIKKQLIKIEHNPQNDDTKIERFPSPIFFKIISDTIYFVGRQDNPRYEIIRGAKFKFHNKTTKKNCYLTVPKEFDIEKFLKYFMVNYNNVDENADYSADSMIDVVNINSISEKEANK